MILILVTNGGDADAAFRIARALQRTYQKFTCYVSGSCKSAGTLIAVGAHELVMCDHGELGPLDVQMYKRDELVRMQSGADVQVALETLADIAFRTFERFFLETLQRSGFSFTVRTAARIATDLTTGLLSPIFQQVDPLHVGETGRAMNIAYQYGRLLNEQGKNLRGAALDELLSGYPSHGFVIDREQAVELFRCVRCPSELEQELESLLDTLCREPQERAGLPPFFAYLSTQRMDGRPEASSRAATQESETGGERNESVDNSQLEPSKATAEASGEAIQATT